MIHKDERVLCTATVHLHAGCPAREAALPRTCAVSKTSVGPQFVAPLGITTSPGSAHAPAAAQLVRVGQGASCTARRQAVSAHLLHS
jgi:hypothetical protein